MINKLKRKFLLVGTLFMFLLMAVLVLIMNLVNYHEVTEDADSVLDMLEQQQKERKGQTLPWSIEDMLPFIPRGMSREVPYESRYFSVLVTEDGEIQQLDLSRIVSVDSDSVITYVTEALSCSGDRGFIDSFRYSKTAETGGTRILFLDCGRKLDSFKSFLWISILVGLGGCIAVFIAFVLTAGRIVAPIAESYEKQKRFISDAGHEIKTPLTIINANVDLLESEGEKEELADIRQQTERLTELTNNLVFLSKMEEAEHTLQKIEYPLSDLVNETVASFRAPAAARDLEFKTVIEENVSANGSPDAIRQLISTLLENAVKYSPDGGQIAVELAAHRKTAVFTVENATAQPMDEKELPLLFDRFYRSDRSRNSATGGHGIGLSIAKAIVTAHGGTIAASAGTGSDFRITVNLPL